MVDDTLPYLLCLDLFFSLCLSLYVCFASISIDLIFSENLPQSETTVKGRIKLPSGELIPEEGLNVEQRFEVAIDKAQDEDTIEGQDGDNAEASETVSNAEELLTALPSGFSTLK